MKNQLEKDPDIETLQNESLIARYGDEQIIEDSAPGVEPPPITEPGQLNPITQEDQRRIQLKGNQPLQPEKDEGVPEGRFETRVRGEVVGSSEVDLSIPANNCLLYTSPSPRDRG